jgi:HAD superfamily hydrolase (TIGR01509 family)
MKNIQGLIFDCDGTLADTMPLHWQAWQIITRKYELHFPEDRFYAMGGVPSRDILKMLSLEQGRQLDPLTASKEKESAYLETLHLVGPIHAVVEIAHAHHGKLPMAVASGGTRFVIEKVLVITSEDVVNQKPAPDIFLEAARRIGVPPAHCRAFEDTDLGMSAIRAAGMDAVDVRVLPGVTAA